MQRPCFIDPFWSPWSSWTGCTSTCGSTGFETRRRSCRDGRNPAQASVRSCPGSGFESRRCNSSPCSRQWSEWGQWSQCNALFCSTTGTQTRSRTCRPLNSQPGRFLRDCPGPRTQSRSCRRNCGIGSWGQWGTWKSCRGNCPSKTQTRRRQCLYTFQTSCVGSRTDVRSCNVGCDSPWEPWGPWGRCSDSCLQTRHRCRICRTSACSSRETKSRYCNVGFCPNLNLRWGAWDIWGQCSSNCSIGIRSRSRQCKVLTSETVSVVLCVRQFGGLASTDEACSGTHCQIAPAWSAWSGYSPCSVTQCGGFGSRVRSRICKQGRLQVRSLLCTGRDTESTIC
uniref:Uncharacterized protein n=1 Tax=Ciona savignyi TaxID=51511 RepID=H2ZQ24_CIOSA